MKRCADDVENMPEELFAAICESAKRYCLWSIEAEKDALGDEYIPQGNGGYACRCIV